MEELIKKLEKIRKLLKEGDLENFKKLFEELQADENYKIIASVMHDVSKKEEIPLPLLHPSEESKRRWKEEKKINMNS